MFVYVRVYVCINVSKIAQAECKDESSLSGFAEAPPVFEATPQRAPPSGNGGGFKKCKDMQI